MAPRSRFNAELLRPLLQQGASLKEIKETLGIKNDQTAKDHILKLMGMDKCYYAVPGATTEGVQDVAVSKKGDLRVPAAALQALGATLAAGTKFRLCAEGENLLLKKI